MTSTALEHESIYRHALIFGDKKMLVIFLVVPTIAAPQKIFFAEESATQILRRDFVRKIFRAIFVVGGIVGRDDFLAVNGFDIRIVKRIDVDRQTVAVPRNSLRERNESEIEARGIIVAHGKFVVGVVFVDEMNFFNRVIRREKFLENVEQVVGNALVANHFAAQNFSAQVLVQKFDVTQFARRHRAIHFERFAGDARKNFVVDFRNFKSLQQAHSFA